MGILHTSFASGNMFTAGSDYGDTGTSGLNEFANRINVESGILGTVSGAGYAVSGVVHTISGAGCVVSGAGYVVSGAVYVESGILGTVSGAGCVVSGAVYVESGILGTVSGAGYIVSGATVTNKGTLDFGLFDIPQTQDMTYTTNSAGNLTAATISGPTHHYTVIGSYNADESPIEIIFSGTSIGSTVKQVFWYQTNGSLATSTGSLISGTMAVY